MQNVSHYHAEDCVHLVFKGFIFSTDKADIIYIDVF